MKQAGSLIVDDEADYQPHNTLVEWIDEWSFKTANTATYTHKIHRYPAMFIPQLVRKIIDQYTQAGDTVLDIFNGSGSTMVECYLTGRNAIGIELNPLANLIAKVKTTIVEPEQLYVCFSDFEKKFKNAKTKANLVEFKNVDFWFEADAKKWISKALAVIDDIGDEDIGDFFKVCLSEIIREVSICKHSGFKMHRDVAKIGVAISDVDFFERFKKVFVKNVRGIEAFNGRAKAFKVKKTQIQGNSTHRQSEIGEESVDLILTSPPYGDSQTTVAYGQFSRLSSQCLGLALDGLEDIGNVDRELLGGKKLAVEHYANLMSRSNTLRNAVEFFQAKIAEIDLGKDDRKKLELRLNDVMSFYYDLDLCLKNGAYYLKKKKHFVLVTGSRVVKMIKLHTDLIIAELADAYGLELTAIFYRNIENKRMPSKVSATNVIGEIAPTMTRESIVVLRKM